VTSLTERLPKLQLVYADATLVTDGPFQFVHIPNLKFHVGENLKVMRALLCPMAHSNYATRLFLEQRIDERPTINGSAANWSVHSILGVAWHTWSWRDVPSDQPFLDILANHVRALR
jgi:hypothetical protein